MTSPLIPWNSCGAYMAATLGVATTAFAPYCFFNIVNPLLTIAFAFFGFRMLRTSTVEPAMASDRSGLIEAPRSIKG